MRYGHVCAGISAPTQAWHKLGWQAQFHSEIDKFPRAVLKHRWPGTPLHGDFTTIEADQYGPVELIIGGTPCQSFSLAGLREGLDDERGSLALEYFKLVDRLRPRWLVWENVRGVLSAHDGRDFGCIVGAMAELGYRGCWRVLDAQYFGKPQQRRRVFLVGYLGDWRPPAAVLFESESLRRDFKPGNRAWKEIAARTAGGATPAGLRLESVPVLSSAEGAADLYLTRSNIGKTLNNQTPLLAFPSNATGDGIEAPGVDVCPTIRGHHNPPAVAFVEDKGGDLRLQGGDGDRTGTVCAGSGNNHRDYVFKPSHYTRGKDGSPRDTVPGLAADADKGDQEALVLQARYGRNGRGGPTETVPALTASAGRTGKGDSAPSVLGYDAVRRLTPIECERLQGMEDNYTRVPYRGRPAEQCKDGPRYKAIGNSMSVEVLTWLGMRIDMVDQLMRQ